jgi:hypothetical protein
MNSSPNCEPSKKPVSYPGESATSPRESGSRAGAVSPAPTLPGPSAQTERLAAGEAASQMAQVFLIVVVIWSMLRK